MGDAAAWAKHYIGHAHTDDLGDASAGVEHQREHQAIKLPRPGVGRYLDDGQTGTCATTISHDRLPKPRTNCYSWAGRVAPPFTDLSTGRKHSCLSASLLSYWMALRAD